VVVALIAIRSFTSTNYLAFDPFTEFTPVDFHLKSSHENTLDLDDADTMDMLESEGL